VINRLGKAITSTINRIPNRYVGNALTWLGLLYTPLENELPLREAIYKSWRRPLTGRVGWLHVLGGVALFLVLVLVSTGILLTFHYEPSQDTARDSVLYVMTEVSSGWLVRGLHRWASELLVVLVFVHVTRTFFARTFRSHRAANWYIGMFILAVVLCLQFTGEILPWDTEAYWRSVQANELGRTVPVWGSIMTHVAGGPDLSNMTLVRYFAFHTIILPWCLFFLLAFHLRTVRRQGIAPPQLRKGRKERSDLEGLVVLRTDVGEEDIRRLEKELKAQGADTRVLQGSEKILIHAEQCTPLMVDGLARDPVVEEIVPLTSAARGRAFFPVHFFRVICAVLLMAGGLVLLSAFVTPIVGPAADPFVRPDTVDVKWYFIWFERIRSLLPAGMGFMAPLIFIVLPVIGLLWPLIDREGTDGPRRPWLTPVTGLALLGLFLALTAWGILS
jgi:quinol-cytochrome oxidoreductase complex cytochrome b subunit